MRRRALVFVVGAPFSGKTDVGKILRSHRGVHVISTKKLLEDHRPDVAHAIIGGAVVNDDIMIPLLREHVPRKGFVLVDAVRSPGQIEALVARENISDVFGLHLTVDEAEVWKRFKVSGETDRGKRPDDTPKTLKKRLDDYQEYSLGLFPVLHRVCRGGFKQVDTHKGIHSVSINIFKFLDQHGIPHDPAPVPELEYENSFQSASAAVAY